MEPEGDDVWNEIIEVSHAFEVELGALVTSNLQATLIGIATLLDEEKDKVGEQLEGEDYDVLNSHLGWVEKAYDDMRVAARNFALVGVVTRLQHWIQRFVDLNEVKPIGESEDPRLCKLVRGLDKALNKQPPITVEFVKELVDARDSVIHGDSKSTWTDDRSQKPRSIAERFEQWGELNVSQSDLEEAVQKTAELVRWYETSLEKAGMKTRSWQTLPIGKIALSAHSQRQPHQRTRPLRLQKSRQRPLRQRERSNSRRSPHARARRAAIRSQTRRPAFCHR
jgi:hypothetical protein